MTIEKQDDKVIYTPEKNAKAQSLVVGLQEARTSGNNYIVVDISNMDYMDSNQMTAFLECSDVLQEQNGTLELWKAKKEVRYVLELVGFQFDGDFADAKTKVPRPDQIDC